jgi:hypothetical protein
MIAEAKNEKYRGVLCIHCRQPIPLSASLVRKEKELRESEPSELNELTSRSFNLRCRACHGEALYTESDTIDCEGTPRTRRSPVRHSSLLKPEPKHLSRAANG